MTNLHCNIQGIASITPAQPYIHISAIIMVTTARHLLRLNSPVYMYIIIGVASLTWLQHGMLK